MTPGDLAQLIRERQPCVVLTGAGVSTESGIPDFRSAEGIWASYDPMEVASIAGFRRDSARVWEFYARRLAVLEDVEPNDAHRALARLEELGLVEAIVTQNVDGLHQRAGSADVLEVHGSIRDAICLGCGATFGLERVRELLPLPRCECGDVLKPGVVMFGELLPEYTIERATALARRARLLIVVGSSLEVHPVAGLPLETLASGGSLAIVNRGPTSLDGRADLRLDGSAGALLRETVQALD
jgi:NAD-dependent deacetylase